MSADSGGPSTVDGPPGESVAPFDVVGWERFLGTPAALALEASFDDGQAEVTGETFVGRSRILGLLPGEKKSITYGGVLFEVSMEPAPVDVPPADRSATASPGDGAIR